ncbi:MAG: nicotinate-nucleotide adenylyltransferase [bacterium]
MNAIGIFGGSFDPVHIGHLITAQSLLEERKLSKIIFIPCNISPHKPAFEYSLGLHRIRMLEVSLENYDQFEVSDYEINKGEISYSIDTIKHFKEQYDNVELIIGYDNLIVFDEWHLPDEIIKLSTLVVLKRRTDMEIKKLHKYFGEAVYVDTPVIEISSTEIRQRVKSNLSIDFLVPLKVKEYIHQYGLYKQ